MGEKPEQKFPVGSWLVNTLDGDYGHVIGHDADGDPCCVWFEDDGYLTGTSSAPGHMRDPIAIVPDAVISTWRRTKFSTMAEAVTESSEGKHFDEGKPRLELVDTYAMEQLGHVLAFGAKKYGEHNWKGGIKYLKLIGSALRHLFAFASGIDNDHESGLPHLAHAMCCCMMLLGTTKLHPELDDRYKGGE